MSNSDNPINPTANAFVSLVDEMLNKGRPLYRFECPECGQSFVDPNDYYYGHDCEVG